MNVKLTRQVDLPNIDYDDMSYIAVPNVPSGTVIQRGSVWCLDITQPGISPASGIQSLVPGGSSTFYPAFTPTAEVVVPPFSANIGNVVGVYQGATFTLTNPPLRSAIPLKQIGAGVVLAAAEGGTAVNTGTNLIASLTQYGAKAGTEASGVQVGTAMGYLINATLLTAVTAGAATPTVSSIVGITTTTALTIDTPSSGVQEIVTPSAVVSGVLANGTYTIGGTVTAGAVLTATNGGVAATYTTVSGDTATTAAAGLVRAINASAAVNGISPILNPATNAAGVVTVRANVAGTAGNSITTVASSSNLGTTTFVAGAGTLASGTNNTFTATFANNHGIGAPVQGIVNGNASTLIPGTASALQEYLINAFIQIR